jgi:lipoprotein signal peptidase
MNRETITDKSKKLKTQKLISVLAVVIGALLVIFKIYEDSEPGAIPLLMIISGTAGYFIARFQKSSQHG